VTSEETEKERQGAPCLFFCSQAKDGFIPESLYTCQTMSSQREIFVWGSGTTTCATAQAP